jgi:two-component sensor histidine kinase
MMQLIEIPPLKRSSSETRLLLHEYSHRINNEFASAIGAISVAAAHSASNEAKAVLAAVQDQLQNYAQVHHALQLPEHNSCIDAAANLQQLCRAISRSKLDRPFRMDSERWRLGIFWNF